MLPTNVLRLIALDRQNSARAVDPETPIPDGQWELVFRRIDSADGDGDGRIERGRLLEMLSTFGRRGSEEYKMAKETLERADVNQDGYLGRKEFYRMVQSVNDKHENHRGRWLTRYLEVAANAERIRCWPPPILTLTAAVAMTTLFVIHALNLNEDNLPLSWEGSHRSYRFCSAFIFNPVKRNEIWRYVTYVIVHSGGEHLCINIFLLLLMGLPLEMSNGTFRVSTVFFTGAISASLGVSALRPGRYLAGASGSVFGLVGGHCASMVLNWKEDEAVTRQQFRLVYGNGLNNNGNSRKARLTKKTRNLRLIRAVCNVTLIAVDLYVSLSRMGCNGSCTSVEAHAIGLVSGFLCGLAVLRNRKVELWEVTGGRAAAIILMTALSSFLMWNVYGDKVLQWWKDNPEAAYFVYPIMGAKQCTYAAG